MTETSATIRAVILDAGGVVLHPSFPWIRRRASEHGLAVSVPALHRAYYRTIYDVDLELDARFPREGAPLLGLAIRRWFFSTLLGHAGAPPAEARRVGDALAPLALAAMPRESDIYHFAMPWVRGHLEALRAAGLLLGAASNNDDALHAQLDSVGVRDLFCDEALMDSGREGVSKPDPELLWRAARALGVPPGRCLFVGDVDRVDGTAARAAGMRFALLDPLLQARPTRPLTIPGLDVLPALVAAIGAA